MIFIFNFKFSIVLKYKYFILLLVTSAFNNFSFGSSNNFINGSTDMLLVNNPPVFSSSNYSYNILETIALGGTAGTVSATDSDGDALAYSISSGNTNGAFSINSSTGSITVVKSLNHHTQNLYNLAVKVSDIEGLSNEAWVVINIEEGVTVSALDSITWGIAANLPYRVSESQGEVVKGKLYTFGGFDSQKSGFTPTSRAYKFDPEINVWKGIAPMPPMNSTNYGGVTHAGFTTDGTDIYFAGGYTSNSTGTGQIYGTKEVWKYIVDQNRYVRLPDLPIAVAAGQLEYLAGRLHHISGTNSSRTLDLGNHYVLNLDSLSAGWKTLSPLPNPRQHAGSVVYENKIYYIGGQHGHDANLVTQKDVHSYNPATNTWTKMTDIPVPAGTNGRGHISAAAILIGKYILVIGGETSNSVTTDMVSAYTPENNTWRNLTQLPLPRRSGVAANLNGLVYYTGGSNSQRTYKGTPFFIQKVASLTLINADTDQPMRTLKNDDTLNLANFPTANINISATTNPPVVGSVKFSLTGPQNYTVIENQFPYALFGDDGNGDYYVWTPSLGKYTLTATPYSNSGAAGSTGYPQTLTFTVINDMSPNVILSCQADAFVRDGNQSGVNYGNDTSLLIKSSSNGYNRSSYLKFSLPSTDGITSAKLRVYGSNTEDNSTVNMFIYGVDSDAWTENNITWNNAPPASATSLSSLAINTPNYYEFDVTNFVQTQPANDNMVSFVIKEKLNTSKLIKVNSKENSRNPPQLVIEYSSSTSQQSRGDSQISNSKFSLPVTGKISTLPSMHYGTIIAKVYPNPLHKTFTIEFEKENKASYNLEIIDPAGRMYELGKFQSGTGRNSMQINISKLGLRAGIYFLSINSATGQKAVLKLKVN
ncbi:MAG: DNRLRE domain-containing protein [Ginsengibacter sp.]